MEMDPRLLLCALEMVVGCGSERWMALGGGSGAGAAPGSIPSRVAKESLSGPGDGLCANPASRSHQPSWRAGTYTRYLCLHWTTRATPHEPTRHLTAPHDDAFVSGSKTLENSKQTHGHAQLFGAGGSALIGSEGDRSQHSTMWSRARLDATP